MYDVKFLKFKFKNVLIEEFPCMWQPRFTKLPPRCSSMTSDGRHTKENMTNKNFTKQSKQCLMKGKLGLAL